MNNSKSILIYGILATGVILANLDSISAECPPGAKCLDFSEIPRLRQEWLDAHPEESSDSNSATKPQITQTSSDDALKESKTPDEKCPPGTKCLDFEDVQRLRQEWLAAHPEENSSNFATEAQTIAPSTEIYVPSLSCVLFKELGCDVQCTIVGYMIGIYGGTSATCDQSLACICTSKTASLDDLWNYKFESNGVLERIKRNKKLAQKVTKVMRNTAFLSSEQSKQELESIVPKNLFKQIQFKKEASESNQEPSNSEAWEVLNDYVDTLVGPTFSESRYFDTTDSNLNWVENYFDFLNQNKHNPSIQKVYHQTRLTEDDYLQGRLDFFLQNKGVLKENKTLEYSQDTTIQQIVTNRVINRMMNELGIPKSFDSESKSPSN